MNAMPMPHEVARDLEARLDRVLNERDESRDKCERYEAVLKTAAKEILVLRRAVEFYAAEENWNIWTLEGDGGDCARRALAQISPAKITPYEPEPDDHDC
jgi:hypothetical protein